MLEQLKKRSVKKSIILIVILLAVGIALMVMEFSNMKALIRGPVAFESLEPDEIGNDLLVDVFVDTNFGAYMEAYETNTKTHYSRTTDVYYVIWTGDADAEDFKYMGIKVPADQESAMEKIAEATYYGEYTDPVTYTGAINKMSSKEYEYFKEYFQEAGWSDEEIEEFTLPYYINVGALTGGAAASAYVLMAIGVILFIAGVWRLIFVLCGGSLKTIKKELAEIGISEHEADYEYESARLFHKGNDMRIGRRLTFFLWGSKPHAISNAKIVWAYQKNTTHRTNGVRTGTTYEVILKTHDKKNFQISVPNEATGQEILQYMNETMPWVVVGYNDDLNKMFLKDYQNFLQIRYNQISHDPYENLQQDAGV